MYFELLLYLGHCAKGFKKHDLICLYKDPI